MKRSLFFLGLIFFGFISHTGFSQELVVLPSEHLNRPDSMYIFTPASYEQGQSYPTLFLLHGFSGCYKDWSEHMDVQALADKYGFIIVCPDGFYNGWYVNSSQPRGPQWRSFFSRELYPYIQKTYMTHPETCFISGLSMGGHGAINIFIDQPDWFRAAGTMSGVMDLHHTNLREKYVSELLGEYSASNARFYTESAINRLENLVPTEKIILIHCAYDDPYAKSSRQFADRCQELGIPYMMMLSPGTHSWAFWTYAVQKQLDIFAQLVKGENLGY